MRRSSSWLKNHRLLAFSILAYAVAWSSWPLYAAGLMPRVEFLAVAPLAAAVIVIVLAEGRRGFRAWARRLVRWRVGWVWYAVALLLPALLVLVTGYVNIALGASAPRLTDLSWSGLLTVFAVRLVNPLDGPLGEEPGFRGYALPLLQGLVLALVSVYLRYATHTGGLGAVGFCFALVGTLDMAGNMWFDGFAGPWIADVAPGAILAGGSGMLAIGGLSSYVLFALGWIVFGIAGWRARMFPAWAGIAFIVAGVLGFNAGLPPYGIPIGLAMAGLGWWIWRGTPHWLPSAR
jgi:hypothetical protein